MDSLLKGGKMIIAFDVDDTLIDADDNPRPENSSTY